MRIKYAYYLGREAANQLVHLTCHCSPRKRSLWSDLARDRFLCSSSLNAHRHQQNLVLSLTVSQDLATSEFQQLCLRCSPISADPVMQAGLLNCARGDEKKQSCQNNSYSTSSLVHTDQIVPESGSKSSTQLLSDCAKQVLASTTEV